MLKICRSTFPEIVSACARRLQAPGNLGKQRRAKEARPVFDILLRWELSFNKDAVKDALQIRADALERVGTQTQVASALYIPKMINPAKVVFFQGMVANDAVILKSLFKQEIIFTII